MKKYWKIALALFALLTGAAIAAPYIYNGSLTVPTGGFIKDTNQGAGCAQYNGSGVLTSHACPTTAPTASPIGQGNIVVSGSYPYTLTVSSPCPSPGANIIITSTFPCVINAVTASPAPTPTPLPCPTAGSGIMVIGSAMPNCIIQLAADPTPTPSATPTPTATPSPTPAPTSEPISGFATACGPPNCGTIAPDPFDDLFTVGTVSVSLPVSYNLTITSGSTTCLWHIADGLGVVKAWGTGPGSFSGAITDGNLGSWDVFMSAAGHVGQVCSISGTVLHY